MGSLTTLPIEASLLRQPLPELSLLVSQRSQDLAGQAGPCAFLRGLARLNLEATVIPTHL